MSTKQYDRTSLPPILRDFLSYHETVKAHSPNTVNEYLLDLRNFLRYMKQIRNPELSGKELDEIDISDVDLDFLAGVTLHDLYDYLSWLARDRVRFQHSPDSDYGISARSRARKIASIRSFYNYLTTKTHQLRENPVKDLDTPKLRKELPRYLTEDESIQLLASVDGDNAERDYCILTLFLNCGLRISELVGLNLPDIRGETVRVLGKGGKVRILYLNGACQEALARYLEVRRPVTGRDAHALFLTTRNARISRSAVHAMVKRRLDDAGLDSSLYSSHKLRHTAATLMLEHGVDVRAVQEVLGHDHLNTTEIYTHIDNESLRVAARANPLSKVRRKEKKDAVGAAGAAGVAGTGGAGGAGGTGSAARAAVSNGAGGPSGTSGKVGASGTTGTAGTAGSCASGTAGADSLSVSGGADQTPETG